MSVPRTLDGFDVTAAVGRMLGDPALWWQAVGIFVAHFANWAEDWEKCVGNDMQERKCVHALRSAAANVGAEILSEDAARLENVLLMRLAGKVDPVPEALRRRLLASFQQTWAAASVAWKSCSSDAAGKA